MTGVLDDYLVDPRVSLLDKTRIQAQVLVPVLRALRAELGNDKADAIVKQALRDWSRQLFAAVGGTVRVANSCTVKDGANGVLSNRRRTVAAGSIEFRQSFVPATFAKKYNRRPKAIPADNFLRGRVLGQGEQFVNFEPLMRRADVDAETALFGEGPGGILVSGPREELLALSRRTAKLAAATRVKLPL
jgi:hypothetical protein